MPIGGSLGLCNPTAPSIKLNPFQALFILVKVVDLPFFFRNVNCGLLTGQINKVRIMRGTKVHIVFTAVFSLFFLDTVSSPRKWYLEYLNRMCILKTRYGILPIPQVRLLWLIIKIVYFEENKDFLFVTVCVWEQEEGSHCL